MTTMRIAILGATGVALYHVSIKVSNDPTSNQFPFLFEHRQNSHLYSPSAKSPPIFSKSYLWFKVMRETWIKSKKRLNPLTSLYRESVAPCFVVIECCKNYDPHWSLGTFETKVVGSNIVRRHHEGATYGCGGLAQW